MLVDHRTYTILPGKIAQFVKIYEEFGLPLQQKYLGDCVGWYTSMDIGQLNQVVHMWRFTDLNDRARRRAEMAADPGWPVYGAQASPLIQHMENQVLSAAPFFQLENLTYRS
jgi:hypothetical protein